MTQKNCIKKNNKEAFQKAMVLECIVVDFFKQIPLFTELPTHTAMKDLDHSEQSTLNYSIHPEL